MAQPLDIMGPGEVATYMGVHRATVSRWQAQGMMPAPDVQLQMGPVWRRSTIERWRAQRAPVGQLDGEHRVV